MSGMDNRDVLEEECFNWFKPVVGEVRRFEEGMQSFKGGMGRNEVDVIRIVN